MLDDQINTRPSSPVVDSLETFAQYLEMQPIYPCTDNNWANINKYSNEDLQTILDIFHEKQEIFHSSTINRDQMDIGSCSDTSPANSFDYSESPPSSTVSQSSHNSDEDPFDSNEWLIQDSSTNLIRPPKLLEFLRLLLGKLHYISYASWLNKNDGIFKIHQPEQVAGLWEKVKNRQTHKNMDYNKFARGIRYYYEHGTMIATYTRHTYRFASNNE